MIVSEKIKRVLVCIVTLVVGGFSVIQVLAEGSGGVTVLDTKNFWRYRMCWMTEQIRNESGSLNRVLVYRTWAKDVKLEPLPPEKVYSLPLPPSDDWVKPDFDDSSWAQTRGNFESLQSNMALLYLRGKFEVLDAGKVGDLSLSLEFQGGAVIYLNGTEMARSHLPKGKISADTPAEDYPKEAYLDSNGKLLNDDPGSERKSPQLYKARYRNITGLKISSSMLKKGVNVLAVELHRTPGVEFMFQSQRSHLWARLGLKNIELVAPAGAALIPGAGRTGRPKGFQVWNHTIVKRLSISDYGDTAEPLRPIRISGTRNGVFSGQVVVSSAESIRGLKVTVDDLKGSDGAIISASVVDVRYPLPDGPRNTFDSLMADSAPAEVHVDSGAGAAIQPIWLAVRVPGNSRGGDYKGKLTINVHGQKPVEAQIELRVADWKMPDSKEFTTHMGLIQSPESVAMKYDVEMWSAKHWELLEKSFQLIGGLGGKVLYIPLIAKSYFGNDHSMVRWIKRPDGGYEHDFSIVESYIDLAVKYLGKIPVVCLYCWESPQFRAVATSTEVEREILFSELDPATGKLEVKKGPVWGTEECRQFWKPVMNKMEYILKKRGLFESMTLGLCCDYWPSEGVVDDLRAVAPSAKWVCHAHNPNQWISTSTNRSRGIRGMQLRYLSFIYAPFNAVDDPEKIPRKGNQRRVYGWKTPYILTPIPRNALGPSRHLSVFRTYPTFWVVATGQWAKWDDKSEEESYSGTDGIGRIGADFWNVLKDSRGNLKDSIAGRYSPSWGWLEMEQAVLAILSPGQDGAIPNIRYEMLRECLQENEARFFIEKVLTDEAKRAKIGEELAKHSQEVLDEGLRAMLLFHGDWFPFSNNWWCYMGSAWQERSERLYFIAAEVAKALGE